ncbi:MAG TPA: quinolinate synthase NadA [Chitinispirillaceae bacterium]|nr:quinolinate synthase NadA [Chitinispirillaceae bacterium]
MNSTVYDTISKLKKEKNAVILAHTYQSGEVQDCADFVGDSYGLSVEAAKVTMDVIIFCGVRFMAETAKILSPTKKVILPEPQAGCPMADMINAKELTEFKRQHPDHIVMCYVNSTAEVKALSDICCTSSNALTITKKIPSEKGILFIPDQHLGSWVQEQTGRKNMVMWNGCCPTHLRITSEMLIEARKKYPDAEILIHPEAPHECRVRADHVLSTGGMCDLIKSSKKNEFIIATEQGIMHTLQKNNPGKVFHHLSDELTCPNMKLGNLDSVVASLEGRGGEEIIVDANVAEKARLSLVRMLEMSK